MSMICFPLKDLTDNTSFEIIANWNCSEYVQRHTGKHFCHPQRDYGIASHLIYAIIHPIMLSKKPWSEISSQSQTDSSLTVQEKDQHRWKNNYIHDTACPSCNHRHEDVVHFFLECSTYQASRKNLMQPVSIFFGDILPDIHHLQTRRVKEKLINILLRGDDRLMVPQTEHYLTLFRITLSCQGGWQGFEYQST